MTLAEDRIELVREDGVVLPALQLVPDLEPAARCHGAGVVVMAGEHGLGAPERAHLIDPLVAAGYHVVAFDLVRGRLAGTAEAARQRAAGLDHAIAIDDLEAALLSLREIASGRLGVVGVGVGAAVALEAAAVLPQLDAVVHVDGPPPARSARLARVRAAIEVHRAAHGTLLAAADVEELRARTRRGKAKLLAHAYPAGDGFVTRPRDAAEASQSRIARDRMRDFLAFALT